MDNKEIALNIIQKVEVSKDKFKGLKQSVEELLLSILKESKNTLLEIPDEKTFLSICAEILDTLIVLPQPFEAVDGIVFNVVVWTIDKFLLDKIFGKNWFENLKSKL